MKKTDTAVELEKFPFRQVIVVGGSGMTGQRVIDLFVPHKEVRILATSRSISGQLPSGPLAVTMSETAGRWSERVQWEPLNFEASESIVEEQLQSMQRHVRIGDPLVLFVAAAFTNVESCEEDQQKNHLINVANTVRALAWGKKLGAHLVFFSTDYVFDGLAGPYDETVPRHALSKYGQSKVAVEEWLEKNASTTSVIIRTTGVYDYIAGSKNFLMQMLEAWGQGRSTRIPSDQYSNPIWAVELAKAAAELAAGRATGIFHVAGGRVLPRHEFARLIAQVFGYDQNLIIPIETRQLNQKAPRPLKSGLECSKVKQKLGWAPETPETILHLLKWTHKR